MKTVFSNRQCAHVWAAQSQEHGHSGTMSFDGPTIYSYGRHYPIASFVRHNTVLFNSTGSSMTTQVRHKPAVHGALRGLPVRVIDVPHRYVTGDDAPGCARELVAEYVALLQSAARARTYGAQLLERAEEKAADLTEYCATFNLPMPELPEFDKAGILAKMREVTAARKLAETERLRLGAEHYAIDLAAWRVHGNKPEIPGRVNYSTHDMPTALRMSPDGTEVETSRGARVSAADAQRLWFLIERAKRTNEQLLVCGTRVSVGAFDLRRIEPDGTAVVGCHTLSYAETSTLVTAQGWAA